MSQQTVNAFIESYQMSKLFWCVDDNHFQEVLNSQKPPVTVQREVKIKSEVRMLSKKEIKDNLKLLKKLKIKF